MVSSFKDVGKSTRELFEKHFDVGFFKFQFETKTDNDVKVTWGGKHDISKNDTVAYLETKIKPRSGISVSTKVDSNAIVQSEVEVEKVVHEDLSQTIIPKFDVETGEKSLLLQNKFKHHKGNATFDMDFKSRFPLLTSAFVVPIPTLSSFIFGAQTVVDTEHQKLQKDVVAVGYKKHGLEMHASLTNRANLDLSIFRELEDMELGFKMGWKKDTRETSFGAVFKYEPTKISKLKVKVDQDCLIGLSYKLQLEKHTSMSFCTQVDGKNFKSGLHNCGVYFEYD